MIFEVGAATLTRPFRATSPVKGEVKQRRSAHRLSPGGRGRTRSVRVRGETLRSHHKLQKSA